MTSDTNVNFYFNEWEVISSFISLRYFAAADNEVWISSSSGKDWP